MLAQLDTGWRLSLALPDPRQQSFPAAAELPSSHGRSSHMFAHYVHLPPSVYQPCMWAITAAHYGDNYLSSNSSCYFHGLELLVVLSVLWSSDGSPTTVSQYTEHENVKAGVHQGHRCTLGSTHT
ncbi:hypothetical protein FQA47_024723 [Oryzias melastigma]|uniref:Uncharacterized protein n=1 Tax=Oryzias melastigma TaxID=30732 RepID=A0A834BW28_ORYME|nr:hypothetical protein FQA47_024723 [Oryzias melastigma]